MTEKKRENKEIERNKDEEREQKDKKKEGWT